MKILILKQGQQPRTKQDLMSSDLVISIIGDGLYKVIKSRTGPPDIIGEFGSVTELEFPTHTVLGEFEHEKVKKLFNTIGSLDMFFTEVDLSMIHVRLDNDNFIHPICKPYHRWVICLPEHREKLLKILNLDEAKS